MKPRDLSRGAVTQLSLGCQLQLYIKNGESVIRSINMYDLAVENQNVKSIFDSSKKVYEYLNESILQLSPYKD